MPTYAVGPGITRFELETGHSLGYMVRIRRNGNQINEFFADVRCGGKRRAKAAAQARYQELVETLGPANTRPTKNVITKRNSSGKVGVHIAYNNDRRWPDCEYWAYCASWVTEDGKREKITFSWNKYGESEAWKLACLARDKECKDRERVLQMFARQSSKQPRKKKTK